MWQKNTFKCWPSSCVCVVSCDFVIALYIYRMIVIERRLWSHTHKHTKSTIVLTTHCQSTKGDIGQSNETSHLNRVVPHQSICTKSNGKCCKVYDRIASNIHSLTHWHKDLIDCHQYCVCVEYTEMFNDQSGATELNRRTMFFESTFNLVSPSMAKMM